MQAETVALAETCCSTELPPAIVLDRPGGVVVMAGQTSHPAPAPTGQGPCRPLVTRCTTASRSQGFIARPSCSACKPNLDEEEHKGFWLVPLGLLLTQAFVPL